MLARRKFLEFVNDEIEQWFEGLHKCIILFRLVTQFCGLVFVWYRQFWSDLTIGSEMIKRMAR